MKISVSLPESDVEFLDGVSAELGLAGRSAAVQRAIRALQEARLESAYAEAMGEWESDDGSAWDAASSDGIR